MKKLLGLLVFLGIFLCIASVHVTVADALAPNSPYAKSGDRPQPRSQETLIKILSNDATKPEDWSRAARELLDHPDLEADILADVWRMALQRESPIAKEYLDRMKGVGRTRCLPVLTKIFVDSCEDSRYKSEPWEILAGMERLGGPDILKRRLEKFVERRDSERLEKLLAAMLQFAADHDTAYKQKRGVSVLEQIPPLGKAAIEPMKEVFRLELATDAKVLIPPILAKIGGVRAKEGLREMLDILHGWDAGEEDDDANTMVVGFDMDPTVEIAIYEALAELAPKETAIDLAWIAGDENETVEMQEVAERLLKKILGPDWQKSVRPIARSRRSRFDDEPPAQAPEDPRKRDPGRDQPDLQTTLIEIEEELPSEPDRRFQELRETVGTSL